MHKNRRGEGETKERKKKKKKKKEKKISKTAEPDTDIATLRPKLKPKTEWNQANGGWMRSEWRRKPKRRGKVRTNRMLIHHRKYSRGKSVFLTTSNNWWALLKFMRLFRFTCFSLSLILFVFSVSKYKSNVGHVLYDILRFITVLLFWRVRARASKQACGRCDRQPTASKHHLSSMYVIKKQIPTSKLRENNDIHCVTASDSERERERQIERAVSMSKIFLPASRPMCLNGLNRNWVLAGANVFLRVTVADVWPTGGKDEIAG